jgi:hypothetical protein
MMTIVGDAKSCDATPQSGEAKDNPADNGHSAPGAHRAEGTTDPGARHSLYPVFVGVR